MIVVEEDDSRELCEPGIEDFITSDVILGLLAIPETGLLRISSALLIAGNNELCAYWWRDRYTGQQHAELRDPVLVKAAFNDAFLDSGYIPAGTIRLGISKSVKWLAVYVPPAPYTLTLLDDRRQNKQPKPPPHTITIGMPGFVLCGYETQYWMWAVKERQVTPHTPVFRYPLPNVGGDGAMCFGANHPPQADGPSIMRALHLFLDSPFNDHWAEGKALCHSGDVRAYLKRLARAGKGKKTSPPVFPEEELVPITTTSPPHQELTIEHLFRRVLGRR